MHFVNAKSILSAKNGMNIYRGCTHGCIYCDSRSDCYQMKHDFEDIEVKQNAPELLLQQIRKRRSPCMIGTGAMCDPYMHCERDLLLTRKCLEIINEYGFGVAVQTKSDLILRDIDLLDSINKKAKAVVQITLTTFDDDLCKIIEPNVCPTSRRAEVLKEFQKTSVPTVVWFSPFLPFINDSKENLDGLLNYCFETGVKGIINFGIGTTLRNGDREYFYKSLDKHFPDLKQKYIRKYGDAYQVMSDRNADLMKHFHSECERHGVMHNNDEIFKYLFTFPQNFTQLSLF